MSQTIHSLGRRRDGFTLIEVLVVMAILGVLVSFVLVAANKHRVSAAEEATRALIQRIDLAMEKYYGYTNAYPPDGFDSDVTNEAGVPIHGSACLHHFLGKAFSFTQNIAGERREKKVEPLMEFRGAERMEDPNNDGVFEIVDAFGTPLHYDNTRNGRFEPQDGTAHMEEVRDHPGDPRENSDDGVVTTEGVQGLKYNIWSHGFGRHDSKSKSLQSTIASWSLRRSTGDVNADEDDE